MGQKERIAWARKMVTHGPEKYAYRDSWARMIGTLGPDRWGLKGPTEMVVWRMCSCYLHHLVELLQPFMSYGCHRSFSLEASIVKPKHLYRRDEPSRKKKKKNWYVAFIQKSKFKYEVVQWGSIVCAFTGYCPDLSSIGDSKLISPAVLT